MEIDVYFLCHRLINFACSLILRPPPDIKPIMVQKGNIPLVCCLSLDAVNGFILVVFVLFDRSIACMASHR